MILARVFVSAVALCAVIFASCGGDEPTQSRGLVEAKAEAKRQAARQAKAEGRLEAVRQQTGGVSSQTGTGGVTGAALQRYTSPSGGWTAKVPAGGGWSQATESEPTPGRLFRTEFVGPDGALLLIDATPFDAPGFSGAPINSRGTAQHPVYGAVEKIIFQGNSRIGLCESYLCVDYLIPAGTGGFAVLAGGPGEFDEIQSVAERVMTILRANDQ